jgi:ribosome maturation factor RimP
LFYLKERVMAPTETWFQQIIAQEVENVELVLLEQTGSGRQKTIRLYVDHPDGVTHELCSRVSEVVGKALDDIDAFEGPFTLEVSSPGLERSLRRLSHFEAQIGKKVYVKARVPGKGNRVWQGRLVEAGTEGIVVEDADGQTRIPLGDISSAHLIYEFK